jgi:hypothetical protein
MTEHDYRSATKLNNNDCDDVNDEKSVSAELSKSFCSPEFVNSTEVM